MWPASGPLSILSGGQVILIPIFYADILALALQPPFEIDSCTTAITGGSNSLPVAMISNIARREDTWNVGHRMLNRNNVALLIHRDNALEQAGIRFMSNG